MISVSTAQVAFAHLDEEVGLGASPEEAKSKAYAGLGRKIGEALAKAIKGHGMNNIQISLTISGLHSFSDVATLLKEIQHVKGVAKAERKNYRDGVLEAVILFSGNVGDFAAALEHLPLTKLQLKEVEGRSITAVVLEQ